MLPFPPAGVLVLPGVFTTGLELGAGVDGAGVDGAGVDGVVVDGVGADLTTPLHLSFLPLIAAVIVVFPFFFATTVPVEFTVATLLFELDHFTLEVGYFTASLKVPPL